MKAGVGYCNNRDAFFSGKVVAMDAIRSGSIERPDLVIAFCSGKTEQEEFLRGMREIVGDTPIVGGGAIGITTNKDLSYSGFPSGSSVFQFAEVRYQIAAVEDLGSDEFLAGSRLARQLSGSPDDKLLLMFYDSIKVPAASPLAPPVINASTPLIAGLQAKLESNQLIIGAGLIGDYQFSSTAQFCGSSPSRQSALVVQLSGSIHVY